MGHPATTREGSEQGGEQQPKLSRQEPYEEPLRAFCQRALDTAEALQGDIERLRSRGRSQTHSQTHSRTYSRSRSRSRSRSCSRACSQSHSQNGSQSRWPRSPDGPPPGRRVIFKRACGRAGFGRKCQRPHGRTLCFRCGDVAGVAS